MNRLTHSRIGFSTVFFVLALLVFPVQGRSGVSLQHPLAHSRELAATVHNTDHQFDHGSGIVIKKLTSVQIGNLVTLGKVWGFLKYHDSAITSGQHQWDYDLFHVLPRILAAPDRSHANAVIVRWIDALGPVAPCHPCAHLKTKNLRLWPDLGWIRNTDILGETLSQKLRWIYRNRKPDQQYYIAATPTVVNGRYSTIFVHERPYREIKFPDSGFQLLALYRFWNIIEYWYPNRNVIGENWDGVLTEFVPKFALAKNFDSYQLQLMLLIAKIHDSHANLWSSEKLQPPAGHCHFPVRLSFIENQPVVTHYVDGKGPGDSQLRISDVITRLDGKPVSEDIKEWAPYYGASNEAARQRYMAVYLTRGPCKVTLVGINRDGQAMNMTVQRVPMGPPPYMVDTDDTLPGPAFRLLSPQVAYMNLVNEPSSRAAVDMLRAAETKGIIFDLRGALASGAFQKVVSLLVSQVTPYDRFAGNTDLSNPGASYFDETPEIIKPVAPHYAGRVIILVNAHTQSASENVATMLQAAPGAIVVGSTTAGVDGFEFRVPLPGGLHTLITCGIAFYPDFRPTQRVGIIPNVVVKPTIADIHAGRDAVLDAALRVILGPKIPISQIVKLYRDQPSQRPGN
ncbi:MAG: S41 family peptidase [Gammaproteobacteria bacterium]